MPVGTSNSANLMITALAEHFSMLLNDAIMYDSSVLHGVGHAKIKLMVTRRKEINGMNRLMEDIEPLRLSVIFSDCGSIA